MPPSPWREMLIEPGAKKHLVLVYRSEGELVTSVASWAARALTTGGGAILVGRPEHRESIARQIHALGVDVEGRTRSGRLLFLDAEETLGRFMRDGVPDAPTFRALVEEAVSSVRRSCGDAHADVRAWGEMVSILHESASGALARELEVLWDNFLMHDEVRLLCSYKLGAVHDLADACDTHASVLIESPGDIEGAARRVMSDLFGEQLPGSALSHVLRRGAVPLGGSPPSALLVPLETWRRPRRAAGA